MILTGGIIGSILGIILEITFSNVHRKLPIWEMRKYIRWIFKRVCLGGMNDGYQ